MWCIWILWLLQSFFPLLLNQDCPFDSWSLHLFPPVTRWSLFNVSWTTHQSMSIAEILNNHYLDLSFVQSCFLFFVQSLLSLVLAGIFGINSWGFLRHQVFTWIQNSYPFKLSLSLLYSQQTPTWSLRFPFLFTPSTPIKCLLFHLPGRSQSPLLPCYSSLYTPFCFSRFFH